MDKGSVEIIKVSYEEYRKYGLPPPKQLSIDGTTKWIITGCTERQVLELKAMYSGQVDYELN